MLNTSLKRHRSTRPRFDFSWEQYRAEKPIVVALDGKSGAEAALPVAAALARHWASPLRLVHVRKAEAEAYESDMCLVDNNQSVALHSRSGAYLSELAASLRDTTGARVDYQATLGSSVEATLRSLCKNAARMLVMVRKQRTLLSRFWWGSVTDRLIGRLAVPLFLVPEKYAADGLASLQSGFSRLLVHFPGDDAKGVVLESAAALAARGAACHLLRVLPLNSEYAAGRGGFPRALERQEADQRQEVWRELFEAKESLDDQGLSARPKLIFDGQTAGPAIVEQSRATQAQAIVVAARSHLLPWWLRDGIAEYVVRHATVPVLVVPADGNAEKLVSTRRDMNHVDFYSN